MDGDRERAGTFFSLHCKNLIPIDNDRFWKIPNQLPGGIAASCFWEVESQVEKK